jgi:hypothetical protein
MTTFAHDLDQLIRRHLNSPRWGDDLEPIVTALHVAACRWAGEADRYRGSGCRRCGCTASQSRTASSASSSLASIGAGCYSWIRSLCISTCCGILHGIDTRSIQDWLGHVSITHTTRYTALSPTRLKDFWRE